MKIILYLSIIFLIVNNLHSQEGSKKNFITASYGFIDGIGFNGDRVIGPIGLKYSRKLNDRLIFGFELSWYNKEFEDTYNTYGYTGTGNNQKYTTYSHVATNKMIYIDFMPTVQYYFSKLIQDKRNHIFCLASVGIRKCLIYPDENLVENYSSYDYVYNEKRIGYKFGLGFDLNVYKNFGINLIFAISNIDIFRLGTIYSF